MNQHLFDDLAAGAPPSTVDLPGIIRREKRRRVALRAGVPAVATLAVASVFAAVGSSTGPAPEQVAGPPPAAAKPAEHAATGFRLVADDKATIATTAASLRSALDDAVRKAAPGATWLEQGLTASPTPDGQPPRIVGDTGQQMFTGVTGISLDGRRGTLTLSIVATGKCTPAPVAKCANDQVSAERIEQGLYACTPAAEKCATTKTPDGRRQRVQTSTSLGGFTSQETSVELADGRALLLSVDNQFSPPGSTSNAGNVAQPATPLAAAEVTAVTTTIGDQILA